MYLADVPQYAKVILTHVVTPADPQYDDFGDLIEFDPDLNWSAYYLEHDATVPIPDAYVVRWGTTGNNEETALRKLLMYLSPNQVTAAMLGGTEVYTVRHTGWHYNSDEHKYLPYLLSTRHEGEKVYRWMSEHDAKQYADNLDQETHLIAIKSKYD